MSKEASGFTNKCEHCGKIITDDMMVFLRDNMIVCRPCVDKIDGRKREKVADEDG